jgi:hypothetical protein
VEFVEIQNSFGAYGGLENVLWNLCTFFLLLLLFGALGDLKCLVEFWKIPTFWCIWGDVKLFCDFYWKFIFFLHMFW